MPVRSVAVMSAAGRSRHAAWKSCAAFDPLRSWGEKTRCSATTWSCTRATGTYGMFIRFPHVARNPSARINPDRAFSHNLDPELPATTAHSDSGVARPAARSERRRPPVANARARTVAGSGYPRRASKPTTARGLDSCTYLKCTLIYSKWSVSTFSIWRLSAFW